MSTKKAAKTTKEKRGVLIENRRVRSKYEILDTWEAGIVLTGGEVKSIRGGQISLNEAWIGLEDDEMWLKRAMIAHYKFDSEKDYDPIRKRKLLLHKKELQRLQSKTAEKGLALLPLKIYETRGKFKVEIGLGKGLAKHDKRRKLKERDEKISTQRQMKRYL